MTRLNDISQVNTSMPYSALMIHTFLFHTKYSSVDSSFWFVCITES